jgi:hypothetical protein
VLGTGRDYVQLESLRLQSQVQAFKLNLSNANAEHHHDDQSFVLTQYVDAHHPGAALRVTEERSSLQAVARDTCRILRMVN